MLSYLARSASTPSGTVPQGAVFALIQRVTWPCPAVDAQLRRWDACNSSIASSSGDHANTLCIPSTSYTTTSPAWPSHAAQLRNPQQLQHARSYRIPYRALLPKVPYSERSGRTAPRPWPELEPVKAAGSAGEIRWHRSVVRFPPEVAVELEGEAAEPAGRTLVLSGKAGSIRLSLQALDPTGLLALRLIRLPAAAGDPTSASPAKPPPAPPSVAPAGGGGANGSGGGRSVLVLVSPDKPRFEAVGQELNKAIRGVMTGYLVGLTVKGVGYRMEPLEEEQGVRRPAPLDASQMLRRSRDPNGGGGAAKPYYFESAAGTEQQQQQQSAITFPYNKPASAIRLKVGYSRAAIYPLPPHIRAFFIRPTLMYLYGIELDELRRVAAEIRSIRKPNPYTGNGIQYTDEVVKLKQRAGAK